METRSRGQCVWAELHRAGRVYTELHLFQNKYALCFPLWARASCATAAAMASTRSCSFVISGIEPSSREGDLREDMNLSLKHTFSHVKSIQLFRAPQGEDCLAGEGTPSPSLPFFQRHPFPFATRSPRAAVFFPPLQKTNPNLSICLLWLRRYIF